MNDLSTIREALEYGKQARPRSPLFDKALADLSRLEPSAGEPVAWMVKTTNTRNGETSFTFATHSDSASYLANERFGFNPAWKHSDPVPLYAHPSPSPSPVELSGFDISSIAHMVVPPDTTNDGEPWYTNSQADRKLGASMAIRHITKHYTLTPKQP